MTTRTPCPDCGTGVVGAHLKRHRGSRFCRHMQERQKYTRELFPLALELKQLAERLAEIAERVKQ